MKIIDASVALKWFVNEPKGQESALRVLEEVEKNPRIFAVPELFFAEMLHVLCRVFADSKKVTEALAILESLGFERIGFGHELLALASKISIDHKVSGYDAIYVASARLLDGQWYTFDEQAHKKLKSLGATQLLA